MLEEVKAKIGKSKKDIERIARTAETLEMRVERRQGKDLRFASGPKDDLGNVYWPDIMLCTQDICNVSDTVKVTGPHVRFTLENGHGQYYILGYYNDTYLVLQKLSSSIEHAAETVQAASGN